MKLNLNECVKVKLTIYGQNILDKHNSEFDGIVNSELEKDISGYQKFQLHRLMFIFGDSMYSSNSLPFADANIIIGDF